MRTRSRTFRTIHVISLYSVLESPVSDLAIDIFGFYETHTSILDSDRMYGRLRAILDGELGDER